MRALTNRSALAAITCSVLLACSSGEEGSPNGEGGGAAQVTDGTLDVSFEPGSGEGSSGGSEGSTASGGDIIDDDGCGAPTTEDACAGQVFAGETLPLDIYIMFDQSGSMINEEEGGITRLDAVRQAVTEFTLDEESRGIGVGIAYFGNQPIGETSCDPGDFADAAVDVGILPDHATDITDSLADIEPTGETPTGAAIRGACEYAQAWQLSNGARDVVILLVTDGKPEAPITSNMGGCSPTLADAVSAAEDCLAADVSIRTYVLGVGPLLENLSDIAAAGGTGEAHLVEGGDVAAKVLEALNLIRTDAIPCALTLPPAPAGQSLDFSVVNLTYSDAECERTTVYYVDALDACDVELGGWYYDDPDDPQNIQLCDSTCDRVGAPGGYLYMTVGCETLVQIR